MRDVWIEGMRVADRVLRSRREVLVVPDERRSLYVRWRSPTCKTFPMIDGANGPAVVATLLEWIEEQEGSLAIARGMLELAIAQGTPFGKLVAGEMRALGWSVVDVRI